MSISPNTDAYKKYPNSDKFINKYSYNYNYGYGVSNYDKNDEVESINPFEKCFEAEMVKKIVIKNKTKKYVIAVVKLDIKD